MDDEFDFFTHKVAPSKPKAKQKVKAATGSQSASQSAPIASTSRGGQNGDDSDLEDGIHDIDEDEEDEDGDVLLSSDIDGVSDDSHGAGRRRAKRRKKNAALPAWVSQGVYRHSSREPSSTLASSTDAPHALASSAGTLQDTTPEISQESKVNGKDANPNPNGNGHPRRVSLTPPPPPSPEKLNMARDLVSRVIGSKFGSASSAEISSLSVDAGSGRATRNSRGSPIPSTAPVNGEDDRDANSHVHWDPDLARLMRGENAKHIREQAKREQQERYQRRRLRQLERIDSQPWSNATASGLADRQAGMSRTRSHATASTNVHDEDEGEDSDDSVKFVSRPGVRASAAPSQQRSTQARTQPPSEVIQVDDSDDEPKSAPAPAAPAPARFSSPADGHGDGDGADEETLTLTLQSKAGSLSVTVTPTTKLSTIIMHFHAHKLCDAGVAQSQIKVTFDGFAYTPTQTVAEMDVEDGDQVELSW